MYWSQKNIRVIASYVSPCSANPQKLFNLYPNPAKDKIIVQSFYEEPFQVAVYNLTNEKVIHVSSEGKEIEINTSKLKVGVYLLKIASESTFETERLVIA